MLSILTGPENLTILSSQTLMESSVTGRHKLGEKDIFPNLLKGTVKVLYV